MSLEFQGSPSRHRSRQRSVAKKEAPAQPMQRRTRPHWFLVLTILSALGCNDPKTAAIDRIRALGGKVDPAARSKAGGDMVEVQFVATAVNHKALEAVAQLGDKCSLRMTDCDILPGALTALKDARDDVAIIFSRCTLQPTSLGELNGNGAVTGLSFADMALNDQSFADLQSVTNLLGFSMYRAKVHGNGLEFLRRSPKLDYVIIQDTPIGDKVISDILAAHDLTGLVLDGTLITDDALSSIARLRHLQRLSVARCAITDRGIKLIYALKDLRELYLYNTGVTDEGLKGVEGLRRLESIGLGNTAVTDDCLPLLARLPDLFWVYARSTRISAVAIQRWLPKAIVDIDVAGTTKETTSGSERFTN